MKELMASAWREAGMELKIELELPVTLEEIIEYNKAHDTFYYSIL